MQKQFNDTLNVVNDRGRIRTLRQETGLTQEEVAHRADLHWSYIGQIERATTNPTYLSLIKLAKGLGVEPAT